MAEHPTTSQTPAPEAPLAPLDDINIPLVAVAVAVFAVALAVLIVSLQALFQNADARETQAKTLAQEDPRTELGKLLAAQRAELSVPPKERNNPRESTAMTATTATAVAQPAAKWLPIDTAMRIVVREYHGSGGGTGGAQP